MQLKLDGMHVVIILAGFALAAFVFWLSVKSGLTGVANGIGAGVGALLLVLGAMMKGSPKQPPPPSDPPPSEPTPPTEPK